MRMVTVPIQGVLPGPFPFVILSEVAAHATTQSKDLCIFKKKRATGRSRALAPAYLEEYGVVKLWPSLTRPQSTAPA